MKKIIIVTAIIIVIASLSYFFYQNEFIDDCAKEGETPTFLDLTTGKEVPDGKYCCDGLKAIGPKTPQTEADRGLCSKVSGSLGICRPCGDGICDSNYEDNCNCPEDCK